jgi:hypothetical protein
VPGEEFFASPGTPFGTHRLGLSIGPLRVGLDGLLAGQAALLEAKFSRFVSPVEQGADVSIGLRQAPVDTFLRFDPGVSESYRLGVRSSGARTFFWSYEFAGWLDAGERRALVSLVQPDGPLFDRGLENFLRIMTASLIVEHGGFLLHGSGIVRDGRAYVFFGPSGSGKTTVTTLSPEDTILSDDLTLVVRNGGHYEAVGIPFGLAHHRVPDTNGSFPIASMNRLIQSRETRREPLGKARSVAEITASLPFVMQDHRRTEGVLSVVEGALETVPVFRLQFRKDASFWDIVQEG